MKDQLGYDPHMTSLHIAPLESQTPTLAENGSTPFHIASLEIPQDVGLTQLHWDEGTLVQLQDKDEITNPMSNFGVTPLHHAARNGNSNPMSTFGVE